MRKRTEALSKRASVLCAMSLAAILSVGALAGCAADGQGASGSDSDPATMIAKTLVKTAANEMTLVDWDVTADDSPLTVSSDDPQFSDYVDDLRELTGFNIESLTMQVKVTEFAGAEIAATHENVKDNMYTIESLDAVVDGQSITYADGDFKKK
ncbi:hypothetical protein [Gordonibacter sp. An230]|uniref:hypothetical protein n=1 Tax=Gordonibacter sp. An230 TaxID=1965592 RepID=UPI001120E8F8|nr:hypothetical protein [Gordonibacter sp. An230]